MASSSTNTNRCTHDVFLSFGKDTRYTFTDHLHQALLDKGISVFIDNKLQRGRDVICQPLEAIEESRVTIVILSEHYPSSSYNLDQLVKILECRESKRQIVFPVFYHVDPIDVEEQRGAFGREFAKLEAWLDKPDIQERATTHIERVQNWKLALTNVVTWSGYHLKEGDGEASVVRKIVNAVLKMLHGENLVGLDSRVE